MVFFHSYATVVKIQKILPANIEWAEKINLIENKYRLKNMRKQLFSLSFFSQSLATPELH
jgi:hypothetical protein